MSRTPPNSPDPVAVRLGYLALLPFALGAALVWFAPAIWSVRAAAATAAYAAVVVSFLGGIYWGVAFRQTDPAGVLLGWGVVPSLLAAAALMLAPAAALGALGAVLIVCYGVDRHFYPVNEIAKYLPLRLHLTWGAAASCLVAAFGVR